MSSYTVRAGDTFASIARRAYGSEQYAGLVQKANPGAVEPLTAGSVISTPPRAGAPTDRPSQAPSSGLNEVAVLINGLRFRFWSDLRLTRALDRIDTLEFSAPFEPDAPGFRETFRPFSYAPLAVTVGADVLFTGTMIGATPMLSSVKKTVGISGYGVPGVLNDCTAPASAYPVEFNEQALPEIAAALAEPFGIPVVFADPGGASFESVALDPSEKILDFLADLARQRSLVVSSTPAGELLFQKSLSSGEPVAVLRQGASPVIEVTPSFSYQEVFSTITGLESVYVGTEGSQYTVKNPHLAGVLRPLTFKSPDVLGGDIAQAVAAKMGRMYGNMVSYTVQVNTWRDANGSLWAPNTIVNLEASGAMIYSPYHFVVRSVSLERNGEIELAELDLVLPGSFSGEAPETLPWD